VTRFNPPLEHSVRSISDHGVRSVGEWSVKLYGIAGKSQTISADLLGFGLETAATALPQPALTSTRYGVGFVVVHEAHSFNTVIVDWWEMVNELRHHVFRASPDAPRSFHEITASGESVCVWELRVQAFERQAWLDTVLTHPRESRFTAYLATRFSESC
jgi:hypothetical protein